MSNEIVHVEKYPYIRAWGQYLGSHSYYIEAQKEEAEKDNAPGTAFFKRSNGTWGVAEDLDPEVRKVVETFL